jgi:hypothetical protein
MKKIKRVFKALKRLWIIGTCDHVNSCVQASMNDDVKIRVCNTCGRVIDGLKYENEFDDYKGITC